MLWEAVICPQKVLDAPSHLRAGIINAGLEDVEEYDVAHFLIVRVSLTAGSNLKK
jgi:hypothetical protein